MLPSIPGHPKEERRELRTRRSLAQGTTIKRLAIPMSRAGFDRAGVLRFGFAPERANRLFGIRFAAMTFRMLTTSTL